MWAVTVICVFTGVCPGSQVDGSITVEPRMAHKTMPAAVYDLRGMAVSDRRSVTKDSGFGRVAVWLEGVNSAGAEPVTAAMQQQNRRFEPELLIVPKGSKVSFPNLDPIFHNIFSLSRAQSFDLGYYAEGKSREVAFPNEGIVQVYCHVHPEMYGVVVVTSSKWAQKPNSDGSFSWPDVPPGKYRLVVWQRSAGLVHKAMTVPPSGSVQISVKLPEEDADR